VVSSHRNQAASAAFDAAELRCSRLVARFAEFDELSELAASKPYYPMEEIAT
jgi:hypothetical protein